MDDVLLIARVLLAGVFAVAGASKLADLAGTRRTIAEFGLPGLAGPLAVALPVAELGIAAALLPAATAWFGAVAALLLLLLLLSAIGFSLADGRKPDCRCFGQIHSAPVGTSTVVLNVALILLAGFVARQGMNNPGPDFFGRIGRLTPTEAAAVAAGVAIVALAALVLRVLRQQGRLSARLDALEEQLAGKDGTPAKPRADEGLPIGTKAPPFALDSLAGGSVTLDHLLAPNNPVLLVFTEPYCGPCEALLPDLARWQREHAGAFSIAVLSEGAAEDTERTIAVHGLQQILLQRKCEITVAYHCEGTPSAVVVRPDGTIGSAVAGGKDAIVRLVSSLASAHPDKLRIGSTIFLSR